MGGVRWTEWLNGWLSFDQTDFNQAMLEGKRDGRKLGAELTLQIDDVAKFIEPFQTALTTFGTKG